MANCYMEEGRLFWHSHKVGLARCQAEGLLWCVKAGRRCDVLRKGVWCVKFRHGAWCNVHARRLDNVFRKGAWSNVFRKGDCCYVPWNLEVFHPRCVWSIIRITTDSQNTTTNNFSSCVLTVNCNSKSTLKGCLVWCAQKQSLVKYAQNGAPVISLEKAPDVMCSDKVPGVRCWERTFYTPEEGSRKCIILYRLRKYEQEARDGNL